MAECVWNPVEIVTHAHGIIVSIPHYGHMHTRSDVTQNLPKHIYFGISAHKVRSTSYGSASQAECPSKMILQATSKQAFDCV